MSVEIPAALRVYLDRVDAMTLRERVMIFLACAAVVVGLAYSMLLQPLLAERAALSRSIQQRQDEMRNWNVQIEAMARARTAGPAGEKRARLADLKTRIADLDIRLGDRRSELVPPERMSSMLADMLRRNRGLQLVSLTTLAPEATAVVPGVPGGQMYRHGIEMTVSGSYLDVVSYLTALERLPVRLFWGGLQLSASYPVVTMKISLFTFSPDKTWLAL
jgi:MSHA biogenesis protein MshJ